MALYESTFIARPDLSKQDVAKLAEKFAGIATAGGAKLIKSEYWGLRNLAYRINKHRRGHYTMLGLDAPPAALKEMERNIRISEDVIRLLTVRVDKLDEQPSAMLAKTSDEPVGDAA